MDFDIMNTPRKKIRPNYAIRSAKQLQLMAAALVIQLDGNPTEDTFRATIADIEYILKKVKVSAGMESAH